MLAQTSAQFSLFRFEQSRANLSDKPIGQVFPRSRVASQHNDNIFPTQYVVTTGRQGTTIQHSVEKSSKWSSPSPTNTSQAVHDVAVRSSSNRNPVSPPELKGYDRSSSPLKPSRRRSETNKTTVPAKKLKVAEASTPKPYARIKGLSAEDKAKVLEARMLRRREQCRLNQARYRIKLRKNKCHDQKWLDKLTEEIQELKKKRQSLQLQTKAVQSPWSTVNEVCRLLDSCFRSPWHGASVEEMLSSVRMRTNLQALESSFAPDVAMGEIRGTATLLEQLRRYTLYFGSPELHFQRVETSGSGVLMAAMKLSVTISTYTMKNVFPHLELPDRCNANIAHSTSLYERLMGKRLQLNCSLTFLFNEENDRVARIETNIDFVGALLGVLGNLKDVSRALEKALITPDGAVGTVTTQR